jgi:hypothetical protein
MTRHDGHCRSTRQVVTLRKERKRGSVDKHDARVGWEIGNPRHSNHYCSMICPDDYPLFMAFVEMRRPRQRERPAVKRAVGRSVKKATGITLVVSHVLPDLE